VEAWKGLGEEGTALLYKFMNEFLVKETIPDKWRESTLIPIFKEKGDVQRCENYRGIKLMSLTRYWREY
jgi:hypothetical protein